MSTLPTLGNSSINHLDCVLLGNQSEAIETAQNAHTPFSFTLERSQMRHLPRASEIRLANGCVGEGALPGNIRLAAITAGMFDEYFTWWKADGKALGASLAP
jgi:hypothetical protein